MGMLKNLKTWFAGSESRISTGIQNTPEYWEGVLKQHEEKVKLCKTKHYETLGKIGAKKEAIENLERVVNKSEELTKRYYSEYSKTNDVTKLSMAKDAFIMAKETKAKIETIEAELAILQDAEKKLRTVKDNATSYMSDVRIKITKCKARVEFNKVIENITDGVADITKVELDGEINVAESYFTNTEKLNEIINSSASIEVSDVDRELEEFIRG